MKQKKIIGIVGGLGPYAHLDFERKLLDAARALAGASADQDFPEWVLSSVPDTPNRTLAILGEGPSPVPALLRSLRRLEASAPAADFAAMPCNTAHHYLAELRAAVSIPILDMIELSVRSIGVSQPGARVGILATTGTLHVRLFQDALARAGHEALSPLDLDDGEDLQSRLVMEPIYGAAEDGKRAGGIKAHGARPEFTAKLEEAAQRLVDAGAEAIVAGCTEIPVALTGPEAAGVPLIDPTRVLAEATIREAYGL